MTEDANSKGENAAKIEMIAFHVGAQEFCVDVMLAREIRVWTPATPVAPATSSYAV
jgi:purine-binding chemotaxis protein CheW